MKWKLLYAFALAVLLAPAAGAQQLEGYFDVMTVKVRPEKRADFDVIIKKMADANRHHQGDRWIASEISYGEGNTVYFTSPRATLGDVDKGMEMFMSAMGKAYGQPGLTKLFQDFNNCVVSSRSEIRRRRPDLSFNMPADMDTMERMVAESRYVRTTMARVLPGRVADYEAQLKVIKEAMEKADTKNVTAVSQSIAGTEGTVFYITTFRARIGGFDGGPSLGQVLGPDAFQKYRKALADTVAATETTISHFLPEMSNPPESFLAASPDYWKPKPTALAKTKPAASSQEKSRTKK